MTIIQDQKGFLSSNRDGGKGDDDIYFLVFNPTPCVRPTPCSPSGRRGYLPQLAGLLHMPV